MRSRWLTVMTFALGLAAAAPSPRARSEGAEATASADEVVASYSAGKITRAELEHVIAQKLPQQRRQIAEPGGRELLLESIIRYDLLAEEAARRGYERHPVVVHAARRAASERMIAERFTADPKSVGADELARVYSERLPQFARPLMRRASHVQLGSEAEAKALRAQAKPGDREGFARLARDHSQDPRTKRQGGELGYFDAHGNVPGGKKSDVPPQLVAATFALKPGQVSPPIAHEGVFSLVMLTGEMPAIPPARAEIEAQLRAELAQAAQDRALEAWQDELRSQAKPEVHPELLDSIVLPPNAPLDIPQGFPAAPPDPRAPPILVEPDGI
jgi:peptidyl-prolyl cis-trans isomerase C